MELRNAKATVMGLGHFGGGAGVAGWLAREGAIVTVTDLADRQTLADSLAALDRQPIFRFHLGGHCDEDFRGADLVVVNPAVRPGNRFVEIARESGAPVTSELELLLRHCPASVIGVTGSNGKSTTAAMIDAILRADGRTCWLGGNIGGSLLERFEWIQPSDWVVLEISSFQLWWLTPAAPMPPVVVVTGCRPNHLDWHRDYADYVATKQRILLGQTRDDRAVLNSFDPEMAAWRPLVRGRCLPPAPLEKIPPLAVPGRHNRTNAACAAAASFAADCSWEAIRRGLAEFPGLPQRLQECGVIDGRKFYNDSAATTPESTVAALESLDQGVWLLAGGKDKGLDYGDLVAAVVEQARGAAFFGLAAGMLQGWAAAGNHRFPCTATETLDDALHWCWERSEPGDAIVLSPACASTDQYQNYRCRGDHFAELVRGLADRPNHY